jgi:hypothetical protein
MTTEEAIAALIDLDPKWKYGPFVAWEDCNLGWAVGRDYTIRVGNREQPDVSCLCEGMNEGEAKALAALLNNLVAHKRI